MRLRNVCTALALGLLSTPAPAMDGVRPVWDPTVITEPGHYVLTRSVTGAVNSDVIVIEADAVSLDLNGQTITASANNSGIKIEVSSLGTPSGIRITNGTIKGGDHGIFGVPTMVELPAVQIEGVEIVTPSMNCIYFTTSVDLEVRESRLSGCGADGIHIAAGGAGIAEIIDTTIREIGGSGILLSSGAGATIRENEIAEFGIGGAVAAGINAQNLGNHGLVIEKNSLTGGNANSSGIILELPNTLLPAVIRENLISGNAKHGLEINGGRVSVGGGIFNANGGDGVRVNDGEFVLIDSSYLVGNGGAGLRFLNGNSHAYRNLFNRGNVEGPVVDQFGNTDGGGNIE